MSTRQTTLRGNVFTALVALGGLLAAHTAAAPLITLQPSFTNTTVGHPVSVNISVSGLGSGVQLGGFDLDIGYNPALLTPTGVTFGSRLGNPALFEALTFFFICYTGRRGRRRGLIAHTCPTRSIATCKLLDCNAVL